MKQLCTYAFLFALLAIGAARAKSPLWSNAQGTQNASAPIQNPTPTFADLDYAPPEPAESKGHKLDLYLPSGATKPLPVVIWTSGSAWMSDNGKNGAAGFAA